MSVSHGAAGRVKLQRERLRWETAEVTLWECDVNVTHMVQFLFCGKTSMENKFNQ